MDEFPDEKIIIDFQDVDLVSVSFADEFVAKLVNEMGSVQFLGRIQLRNMSNFTSWSIDEVIKPWLGSASDRGVSGGGTCGPVLEGGGAGISRQAVRWSR